MARRGRPPAIDAARVREAAAVMRLIIEGKLGLDLVYSPRMGYMLRRWDSGSTDYLGRPCMRWVEIDSAPEEQLDALLLRQLQRQRPRRAVQPKPETVHP